MKSLANWRTWTIAVALVGSCGWLHAAEPVRLLRPTSLVGWEYGPQAPAGWTIKDGRLSGSDKSTPLLSGWTFGDVELRFAWSAGPGGAIELGLVGVPNGEGWTITLAEGERCGQVREGGKELASGAKIDPPSGAPMHSADIRKSGGTLSVIVDRKVVAEVSIDRSRRVGLALAVAGGEASLEGLTAEEPFGNALFNGHDLDGWFVNNKRGTWTVDAGDIIPTSHQGLHYLRTDDEYANFTLALEYTISRGGNSGLAIRTAKDGWPSGDGMELQILDQPGEVKDSTMAIYGNLPPLDRQDKSLEWNRVVVKADGRMISAWVNGELVQHANTGWLSELKHRHLKGWIGVQDHGGKVRFRNIYLNVAPDGLGLDAWQQSARETAQTVVLDRLMNTERLSRDDGIRSGVVSTTVPKGGEHVLAELTGPGAIVRSWQSYPSGRLAFYFDGESQPRIECATEHLFDDVPGVAHEDQPALMCLAYAKSLKIVVSDPLPSTFRFDYVTLPKDVPLESFTVKNPGLPRGMAAAINYRHESLSGGKLREAEIYERIVSEPRTIGPGTSVELVSTEGVGIVNWLKLAAARSNLSDDNLWIEVTIDGESLPAIAAPARFLVPAYGAAEPSRDFSTLVMANKDGYANLLAMPFGAGIKVAARNRGSKPIEKVGLSMSVDRRDRQESRRLCRPDAAAGHLPAGRYRVEGTGEPGGQRALGGARLCPGRSRDRDRVARRRRQAANRLGDERAR